MKMILPCLHCFEDVRNLEKGSFESLEADEMMATVEVNNTGLYEITCKKGHTSYTKIQNFKYEMLFEMGMCALKSGFYNEAISSLAASLERFFELSINLLCKINNVSSAEYDITWKTVASQSERQLGAYNFLYLSTYKKAPLKHEPEQIAFRNKVIHKGYIPTKEESFRYAKYVYEYVTANISEFKSNHQDAIRDLTYEHLLKIQNDKSTNCSLSCLPTSLSFTIGGEFESFESLCAKSRTANIVFG